MVFMLSGRFGDGERICINFWTNVAEWFPVNVAFPDFTSSWKRWMASGPVFRGVSASWSHPRPSEMLSLIPASVTTISETNPRTKIGRLDSVWCDHDWQVDEYLFGLWCESVPHVRSKVKVVHKVDPTSYKCMSLSTHISWITGHCQFLR